MGMLHLGKQRENATLDSLQDDSLSLRKEVSVLARQKKKKKENNTVVLEEKCLLGTYT